MKKKIKIISYIILVLTMFTFLTNVNAMDRVSCGNVTNIPKKIPELTSWVMTVIQILVPVVLVIMGSLDFFKGMTAQKEDEIKSGQKKFVKRLILSVIIFLIIAIVKFIVSIVANTVEDTYGKNESTNISECIDCFLNGADKCKDYTKPNKTTTTDEKKTTTKKKTTAKTTTKKTVTKKVRVSSWDDSEDNNKTTSTTTSSTSNSSTSKTKSTSSSDSNSSTSKIKLTSSSDSKKYNLFLGDSRTVGMCDVKGLCSGEEKIAEVGTRYLWFNKTAVPKATSKLKKKNYNIIILMGVNDVGAKTSTGTAAAKNYYDRVSKLATSDWKKANVIFVSVNPVVDGGSYAYMAGVNAFNKTMKSSISQSSISNLSYCDTASSLNITSKNTDKAGLHYNSDVYKKIHEVIVTKCL